MAVIQFKPKKLIGPVCWGLSALFQSAFRQDELCRTVDVGRQCGPRRRTDVSSETQVDAMFVELKARSGALDVLVNNAGIAGSIAAVEDPALADWDQTNSVNLTRPSLCTCRAVPLLKAAGGGCIVNLSSIAGWLGF